MTDRYEPVALDTNWIQNRLKSSDTLTDEYEVRADEYHLLDELIRARKEAGLTQQQLADRMGKQQSAIGRLERILSKPDGSVSIATLREYAAACGKKLSIHLVD